MMSHVMWPAMASVLLKASIIVTCAALATTVLRRYSAATRHAIWRLAFVALLGLPVLEATLPSWRVAPPVTSTPSSLTSQFVSIDADRFAVRPVTAMPMDDSSIVKWSAIDMLVPLSLAVWILGTLFLLGRLAVHAYRVSRISARACPAPHHIRRKTLDAATASGVRRSIRTLLTNEIAFPASSGELRPVVLLPVASRDWPDERLDIVTMHEVAHIARHDYLFHLITEFTRAIYWINPLVWFAAHRSDIERERACDDAALRAGVPSRSYATRLLEMARFQLTQRHPTNALAMARHAGLTERIRGILDRTQDRAPLTKKRLALFSVIAALITVPVAALQFTREPVPTIDAILEDLQSEDVRTARRAAWWLGEREDPATVDALIEALRQSHPDVRLVAAWALGEIKDARAVQELAAALDDGDPAMREMVTLALGETEHPDALQPLLRAFEADHALRPAAYWAAGEIPTSDAAAAQREMARQLQDIPSRHEEVWFGQMDERFSDASNVETLIRELSSPSVSTRRQAAWNLGILGSRDGVDPLLDVLRDPEPSVRAMAIWALDEINPSRAR